MSEYVMCTPEQKKIINQLREEIAQLKEQLGKLSVYKRILDHIYDPYASPEEQKRRLFEQLSEYVILEAQQQRK